MEKDLNLLKAAYRAWLSADELRTRRQRYKRYTYGDQWCDAVPGEDGAMIEERREMMARGHYPLTNNLIRPLVKTIVGRYRTIAAEGALYDTDPAGDDTRNRQCELDCRMLEEFVISGCAIQRIVRERRPAGDGVWVDNVAPDKFFVSDFRDPRGFDIDFVGMLHDMTSAEIINRFGRGRRQRCEALQRIISAGAANAIFDDDTSIGSATPAGTDFFVARPGRVRIIEVWRLADMRATDACGRYYSRPVWQCSWLATDGTVLASYSSPWAHGSHPFAVKFYPLTDGEVHSFVEDVIDQQRTVNRLVVLVDSMLASSAKGALLFPISQLPKGMTIDNITKVWARPGALIPIRGQSAGEMPVQVTAPSGDAGAHKLLDLQMKLFEDISGISDALLGRNVAASTGSALYDAQVRQASVSLLDLIDTFISFTADRASKVRAS